MIKIIVSLLFLGILLSGSQCLAQLRDPTLPENYKTTQKSKATSPLVLSAILISPNRSIAIINGKTVKVGDEFMGNKIIAIDPNSVRLESSEGLITLFLVENKVKQKASSRGLSTGPSEKKGVLDEME